MNNAMIQDVMLGAVVVLLGYAAYQRFKQPKAPPADQRPVPYGLHPTMRDLLGGAVHDIGGGYGGHDWLRDLEQPGGAW